MSCSTTRGATTASTTTPDPITAIAVGGNTLSRGLTLEGLVVSYFVRSVNAYDTLLQMGRWFGYREGYADLPRIWMTDELERVVPPPRDGRGGTPRGHRGAT